VGTRATYTIAAAGIGALALGALAVLWSIEPGPMQMLGIPPLERCAASENHGAPANPVVGSVASSAWIIG